MMIVIVLRAGLRVGVFVVSIPWRHSTLRSMTEREMEDGGKIDKWLIAFTLVIETDTVRDRERNMETERESVIETQRGRERKKW